MPTPTIPAGNLFMNATLYTGNGSTQTITNGAAGQSFQPDFVWVKSRSAATDHKLTDSVRGVQKGLISNTTGAETTDTNGLTAFNSNGWSLGTNTVYNNNTATYVAWQWKAGGTAVTNTSGTISSQVSANTTSGFSIVTYTGTGANATVGHGLGVAPSMIIVKSRVNAYNWVVYNSNIGNTKKLYLDLTDGSVTDSTAWNNTSATSSVFSLGSNVGVNQSSSNYVAYCWAPIAGYSAFGSYTGNGSADGSFVYTGFQPRFVMVKRTDSGGDWGILDTSRTTYNVSSLNLFPNDSRAEGNLGFSADLLSNGFKLRTTDTFFNASGGTYVYACFASNPFKYSNAR